MDKTVGIVGLGIMGSAIARNLVERGWRVIGFDIDADRRHRLLNGLDDIGLTLKYMDKIKAYEAQRKQVTPWLFN